MIEKAIFMAKLKELAALTCKRISKASAEVLYVKLYTAEEEDFAKAIESLAKEDVPVSYASLSRHIDMHEKDRSDRLKRCAQERERSEAMEFFGKEQRQGISQACNRECGECRIKYCDFIAKANISSVKNILRGQSTPSVERERLSREFPRIAIGDEPF